VPQLQSRIVRTGDGPAGRGVPHRLAAVLPQVVGQTSTGGSGHIDSLRPAESGDDSVPLPAGRHPSGGLRDEPCPVGLDAGDHRGGTQLTGTSSRIPPAHQRRTRARSSTTAHTPPGSCEDVNEGSAPGDAAAQRSQVRHEGG
jgi:hypothetical protein